MKYLTTLFISLLIALTSEPLNAQEKVQVFSIEAEPVAYILGGAGITGSYQHGPWIYSIEAFGGLTVPESLHGNEGFETSLRGLEPQVERFLNGTDGFFAGPEVGVSRLQVTRKSTGIRETHTNYAVGFRSGYHWNTGLGNLYLSPVLGISYALNSDDIQIGNGTFESGPVTPFATVGIGWSF